MMVKNILHASFVVQNLEHSLAFYCDLVGLELDSERPDLGYPGAWLKVGAGQQLHLLQLPNPDPVTGRPAHVGRDRHVALAIDNIAALMTKLQAADLPYTQSKSGRRAVFCRDPDGNGLEFIEE